MNKKVKKQWISALKSGNYKQGVGQLKIVKNKKKAGYCCLGVLCDLYAKENHIKWDSSSVEDCRELLNAKIALPSEVQDWAGLDSDDPLIGGNYASSWNDAKELKFPEIAKLIKKHL